MKAVGEQNDDGSRHVLLGPDLGESADEAIRPAHGIDGRVGVTLRVRGPAAAFILVAADQLNELVVVGTRGRSVLAHPAHGSVAETVARMASCSVLAVRLGADRTAGTAEQRVHA